MNSHALRLPTDSTGGRREELFRQSLPGLAVGSVLGRTSTLPIGDAIGDQTSDGCPARVIGAEHLAKEDPQRRERRVGPIDPTALDRGERG